MEEDGADVRRFDDNLERGGYRASADVHMFIPAIAAAILLVLVVTAFVIVAKQDIAARRAVNAADSVIAATETEIP